VQSFTDRPKRRCPACKQSALRKVLHPAGIIFKGSGFYKTDSRSGGGKAAEKPEAAKGDSPKTDSPKADANKSEGPKAASKPAATTAASSPPD
jgi:predicted nucleic acid-binding Zn ribbon protein